jgi:hypothetical protein
VENKMPAKLKTKRLGKGCFIGFVNHPILKYQIAKIITNIEFSGNSVRFSSIQPLEYVFWPVHGVVEFLQD